MLTEIVITSGAAFALGYFVGRADKRETRPGRLVPMTRHAMTAPALAATPSGRWDLYLQSFALAGDSCRFSLRAMRGEFCSEPAWRTYTGLLVQIGALEIRPRAGTRWADGWSVRHLRQVLKHGVIAPAYPAGEPPAVGWRVGRSADAARQTVRQDYRQ